MISLAMPTIVALPAPTTQPPTGKRWRRAPIGLRLPGNLLGRPLLVAVCLLTLTCSAPGPGGGAKANRPPATGDESSELTPAPPLPDASPIRLLIPRISVDAAIEARGLDAARNLATPQDFNHVAWFNQSPTPGTPGNAVINGHVDWWTGSAVFTRLGELRPGDAVIVMRRDGNRTTFKVSALRTLAATARDASLFAPTAASTLTLITCAGPWDFKLGSTTQRLLVSAALD
jgi:LPXTG-site transpeptidase (sortase) family protein